MAHDSMENFFESSKPIRRGDEIETTIESLAFGGEGVAKIPVQDHTGHTSHLTLFVEDVVPGDQVKVSIAHKKQKWARGYVRELMQPSPLRIAPRCKHFGTENQKSASVEGKSETGKDNGHPNGSRNGSEKQHGCGGCVWQFLAYEQQLKFKEQQVRDAFERIGGLKEAKILPILGMKNPWYYRNKMEFSFQIEPDRLGLGLHLKRRHYDVIELEECFLLAPYVGKFVQSARTFFRSFLIEHSIDPHLKLQSLTIREGKNTSEIMVIVSAENGEENFMKDFEKFARDFFEKEKLHLASLYFVHTINQKGRPKIFKEILHYGQPTIREILKVGEQELLFEISPQAFFQPNTLQAQVLYEQALHAAHLSGKEVVYDLYCGTGTIGLAAAAHAQKVYGIELNASAVENARANARLNQREHLEFFQGDVEKVLPTLSQNPDIVMLDPPRNGLQPKAIELVLGLKAPRIVYVSCNPTTLARDAQILVRNGYRLEQVQPVDMFPQTYHIENVAAFTLIQ